MQIITTQQAEAKGFIPITTTFKPDDENLFQVYRDFLTIPRSEWSLVAENGRVSIWRKPIVSTTESPFNDPTRRKIGGRRRYLKLNLKAS